jgi:hypothetical protein
MRRLGNKGMALDRVVMGIGGLFIITAVYIIGDPILHGKIYELCYTGTGQKDLCDSYLRGWTTVFPVFIFACFYLILSGGRTHDRPSEYRGWGG